MWHKNTHKSHEKEKEGGTGRQAETKSLKKITLWSLFFFGGVVNIGSKILTNKILYKNPKHK